MQRQFEGLFCCILANPSNALPICFSVCPSFLLSIESMKKASNHSNIIELARQNYVTIPIFLVSISRYVLDKMGTLFPR